MFYDDVKEFVLYVDGKHVQQQVKGWSTNILHPSHCKNYGKNN